MVNPKNESTNIDPRSDDLDYLDCIYLANSHQSSIPPDASETHDAEADAHTNAVTTTMADSVEREDSSGAGARRNINSKPEIAPRKYKEAGQYRQPEPIPILLSYWPDPGCWETFDEGVREDSMGETAANSSMGEELERFGEPVGKATHHEIVSESTQTHLFPASGEDMDNVSLGANSKSQVRSDGLVTKMMGRVLGWLQHQEAAKL